MKAAGGARMPRLTTAQFALGSTSESIVDPGDDQVEALVNDFFDRV